MKKNNLNHVVWSAALRLIERRPRSTKELKNRLLSKFPEEEEDVTKVIEEMECVHLLNDKRFAEAFISHLIQKNIGRLKIMHETRQKGLPINLVEQLLLTLEWSEEAVAKQAMEEKTRVLGSLDERKKKQKLMSFLRNRGFSDRVIFLTLKGQ